MYHRPEKKLREGATVVECAVVYPATFMLLLGLVVGGLGIFRFQEAAALARAGTRYGSTHGYQFRADAGLPTGSPGTTNGTTTDTTTWYWYKVDPTRPSGQDSSWAGDIYDQAVRPNLIGLDPSQVTFEVAWPQVINQPKPDNWPGSRLQVRVSYSWMPEIFFIGPINLTSTSTLPITN